MPLASAWWACQLHRRRDQDLRGINLSNADLDDADLSGSDVRGTSFSGASMRGADLDDAINGTSAKAKDTRMLGSLHPRGDQAKRRYRTKFAGADLTGASLRGAKLARSDFQRADLTGAQLRGASLSLSRFSWAKLTAVHAQRVNLSFGQLTWADLTRADFRDGVFIGADIRDARLCHTKWGGADTQRLITGDQRGC